MMKVVSFASFLLSAGLVSSNPVFSPRAVSSLNEAATAEAQQRDGTATRAFSNVQIKTADGQCLFVDKLSGDFRENLTPIQVGFCGSTDGQGWDVITAGKHINVANSMLVVSTLTNACFNFDDRRAAGNQVLLFSCGGRADGGGAVTNSQIFAFGGGQGPLAFQPSNSQGKCLAVKGKVLDIANCNDGDSSQSFTFGGAAASTNNSDSNGTAGSGSGSSSDVSSASATTVASSSTKTKSRSTAAKASPADITPTAGESGASASPTDDSSTAVAEAPAATSAASNSSSSSSSPNNNNNNGATKANPTEAVPVSRAGGTLNPTAAAQSQQRDDTATRAFSGASIRAPNGQCISVDPTAGDFRQNLIPVTLADCTGAPNEKWDVIRAGKHNDKADSALVVSSLMQGCISFDGRRATGDTVTMFSCGGRADGEGGTNTGQLFPFIGEESFAFAPESEGNKTCIIPGDGRLDSGPCPGNGASLFSVSP